MTNFKIRRGLSSELFINGQINKSLIIEEGCWYLCSDTAELFLGVRANDKLILKKINAGGDNGNTGSTPVVSISYAEINDKGNLVIYYSDGTYADVGRVVGEPGKDGLTTAVKVGDTTFTSENGIITLPGFATEAFVLDAIANADLDVNLDEYAKKSDIPDTSKFITSIPDEYITEAELDAKGFLTDHQDLGGKADKEHKHVLSDISDYVAPEIPSLDGYATETYVTDAIAAIPETDLSEYAKKSDIPAAPDLSDYAKKSDLPDTSKFITAIPDNYVTEESLASKGFITEHQSLEGLATESFVTEKIAEAQLGGGDVNLSDYATKEDISGLASSDYVDQKFSMVSDTVASTIETFILHGGDATP